MAREGPIKARFCDRDGSWHSFSLVQVHMYNHVLRYEDEQGVIEVIVEDSPRSKEGLLVWQLDFSEDPERRQLMLERFIAWAQKEFLSYTIIYDKKRG